MTEQIFHIPKSFFEIRCVTKEIPLDHAAAYLSRRRQRKTTECFRKGDKVIQKKHIVVCMNCGKGTPAYKEYLEDGPEGLSFEREVLEKWTTNQLSFFHGLMPDIVRFNRPVEPTVFRCPHCRRRLVKSRQEYTVRLRKTRHQIHVQMTISDEEREEYPWPGIEKIPGPFLQESLTFSTGSGRTYVTIEDRKGRFRWIRDITDQDESLTEQFLSCALLRICRPLRREIRKMLAAEWGTPLPMASSDGIRDLILMTRFIGYPKGFYDDLPFSENGTGIQKSFRKQAKRLRRSSSVQKLVGTMDIFSGKQVRKTIYERPALLFYDRELTRLRELIRNQDLFQNVLKDKDIFFMLADWKRYPGKWLFLHKVREKLTESELSRILTDLSVHPCAMNYMSKYLLQNRPGQLREQKKWSLSFFRRQFSDPNGEGWDDGRLEDFCSVPVPETSLSMYSSMETAFGGFSFRLLRNAAEYVKAGRRLSNCLVQWKSFIAGGNAVFIVWEGEIPVAAVEVENAMIVQAKLSHNEALRSDPEVEAAVKCWAEKNALTLEED